jgi:hypothetical protein
MAECECCSTLCLGCCDNHHICLGCCDNHHICSLDIDKLYYVCCCMDHDKYTTVPINTDLQTNYGTHKIDVNNYADAIYATVVTSQTENPICDTSDDISSIVKTSAKQKMT